MGKCVGQSHTYTLRLMAQQAGVQGKSMGRRVRHWLSLRRYRATAREDQRKAIKDFSAHSGTRTRGACTDRPPPLAQASPP
jgi:hypothetical protein